SRAFDLDARLLEYSAALVLRALAFVYAAFRRVGELLALQREPSPFGLGFAERALECAVQLRQVALRFVEYGAIEAEPLRDGARPAWSRRRPSIPDSASWQRRARSAAAMWRGPPSRAPHLHRDRCRRRSRRATPDRPARRPAVSRRRCAGAMRMSRATAGSTV